MTTVNVLNQMAEYDFNAPINVEMIFEDSDNDDPSSQSSQCEQQYSNDKNNNKKQVPDEKSGTNSKKHNKISENQINNKSLNKSMLSLKENNRILQRTPSEEVSQNNEFQNLNNNKNAEKIKNSNDIERNQNTFDANPHAMDLVYNNTINDEETLPDIRQTNEHQEPATFIEDLLNKLSENLFRIIQSFIHYGTKTPNTDIKKREQVFNLIKFYFYELSYSTVESIILPQEQNEYFINKFVDNTVLIINNKFLQWRCSRRHVLPFFKELMTWTKQKKESIKINPPPNTSNENTMLKQQLVRPLLPLNLPQSEIVANSNGASQKTQNNLCIFSSGPPGNEISINIDANTLNQINKRQLLTVKEAEQNGNNNNFAKSCEKSARRKTPVASAPYRNHVKHFQKNNLQFDQPAPPPYHATHNPRISYGPQQYSHSHTGQPHQNPSMGQHNYPTQVHYINTNHTSSSPVLKNYMYDNTNNIPLDRTQIENRVTNHTSSSPVLKNYMYVNTNNNIPLHRTQTEHRVTNHTTPSPVLKNYMYDNTNNNIPLHRTQIENVVTSSPVISTVSSLNPTTRMLMFRCYMCGKKATAPCNPYNPPCRLYFCSHLCQELESQFYKPTWGNT